MDVSTVLYRTEVLMNRLWTLAIRAGVVSINQGKSAVKDHHEGDLVDTVWKEGKWGQGRLEQILDVLEGKVANDD